VRSAARRPQAGRQTRGVTMAALPGHRPVMTISAHESHFVTWGARRTRDTGAGIDRVRPSRRIDVSNSVSRASETSGRRRRARRVNVRLHGQHVSVLGLRPLTPRRAAALAPGRPARIVVSAARREWWKPGARPRCTGVDDSTPRRASRGHGGALGFAALRWPWGHVIAAG